VASDPLLTTAWNLWNISPKGELDAYRISLASVAHSARWKPVSVGSILGFDLLCLVVFGAILNWI